jgi:hypothetical protein
MVTGKEKLGGKIVREKRDSLETGSLEFASSLLVPERLSVSRPLNGEGKG